MGLCVVENLSRVFLFEWLLILLWVMRVYIIWVKDKKVTLKNPPSRMFCEYFLEGFTLETLAKLTAWHNSPASSHVLLTWLFRGLASRDLLAKSTYSSNTCSIFHQLNTKPNKIKSQKIQGIKLKQLQHFLSWNKTNIKHSCKSQFYNIYIYIYIYDKHTHIIVSNVKRVN